MKKRIRDPLKLQRYRVKHHEIRVDRRTTLLHKSSHMRHISLDTWKPVRPALDWSISTVVPFTYAYSKNQTFGINARRKKNHGRVFIRAKAKRARDLLTSALALAVASRPDIRIYQQKLWIDILVQKPNHRGDAVNVLDAVCDSIKQIIPLDDRWYSINSLDWLIVRDNPQLFVSFGQIHTEEDCMICTICGDIMPRSTMYVSVRECENCHEKLRIQNRSSVLEEEISPEEDEISPEEDEIILPDESAD